MKKPLIGKQKNLPKELRDKILASPAKMLKPAALKMMKKSPNKLVDAKKVAKNVKKAVRNVPKNIAKAAKGIAVGAKKVKAKISPAKMMKKSAAKMMKKSAAKMKMKKK